MPYTSHGHHIPNTTDEGWEGPVAKCGGVNLCKVCHKDQVTYIASQIIPEKLRRMTPANVDEFSFEVNCPACDSVVTMHARTTTSLIFDGSAPPGYGSLGVDADIDEVLHKCQKPLSA
jgi:hypothetical protein